MNEKFIGQEFETYNCLGIEETGQLGAMICLNDKQYCLALDSSS